MSYSPVIEFSNVTKVYSSRTGLLRVRNVIDRVKNFQIGTKTIRADDFIALRDISFVVNAGEKVGVIGNNGAGKSTTLKLISGVTTPSSGCVKVKGRVGGVLELGSGFHPDLTALENVYFQGAIYGIPKDEMRSLVPKVFEIAELKEFENVPVKKFSSGMKVRLGFAAAMITTPDIVLLDEVLAVGDRSFKQKSEKVMKQFIQGRTLIFVSHSLPSVQRICERVIVLDNGALVFDGKVSDGIKIYKEEVAKGNFSASRCGVISSAPRGEPTFPRVSIESITQQEVSRDGRKKFLLQLSRPRGVANFVVFVEVRRLAVSNVFSTLYSKNYRFKIGDLDAFDDKVQISFCTKYLVPGLYELNCRCEAVKERKFSAKVIKSQRFEISDPRVFGPDTLVDLDLAVHADGIEEAK